MIYEYKEELLKQKNKKNIFGEHAPYEYNADLVPLFLNYKGNIFYGGFFHYQYNMKTQCCLILKEFLNDIFINEQSKSFSFEKVLSKPTSMLNANIKDFSYSQLQKTFVDLSLVDQLKYFHHEVYEMWDHVNSALLQLKKPLFELGSKSNGNSETLKKLFEFLKLDTSGLYTKAISCDNYEKFNEEILKWYNLISQTAIDIAVLYSGLDKIETTAKKSITTIKHNVYETYFNYMLMDFKINRLSKILYNSNEENFYWYYNDFLLKTEQEYKDEIELIRKKVPLDQRYKYFL